MISYAAGYTPCSALFGVIASSRIVTRVPSAMRYKSQSSAATTAGAPPAYINACPAYHSVKSPGTSLRVVPPVAVSVLRQLMIMASASITCPASALPNGVYWPLLR